MKLQCNFLLCAVFPVMNVNSHLCLVILIRATTYVHDILSNWFVRVPVNSLVLEPYRGVGTPTLSNIQYTLMSPLMPWCTPYKYMWQMWQFFLVFQPCIHPQQTLAVCVRVCVLTSLPQETADVVSIGGLFTCGLCVEHPPGSPTRSLNCRKSTIFIQHHHSGLGSVWLSNSRKVNNNCMLKACNPLEFIQP